MTNNLWGVEFEIKNEKRDVKKVLDLTKNVKSISTVDRSKYLKSKTVSIEDKLKLIESEVLRILGVYKNNTVLIRSYDELIDYIDNSIRNNIISIDTETNNSLDPLTCKIMGGCIYTPGMKNAYIPINHVDLYTDERLDWQITEEQLGEQLKRLKDTKIIMHNGKFDYKVIKCTCDVALDIYWDTMVGAKILNENERAGLKQQYISKIDPSIEKYSIDKLFEKIPYAKVKPEIFALYSATDAFMTHKLYEYQVEQFSKPENSKLYTLFREVETPLTQIIAEMELQGVCIDLEYGKRLSNKFHNTLDKLNEDLEEYLKSLKPTIENWRITPEANETKIVKGKKQKSKNEQLTDPININSPVQLAIILYDILKLPPFNKKTPRGTGEDALKKVQDRVPFVKTILEIRGMEKLLGTYVDKLPEILSPRDGKLHGEFLQFGADTGRFSSKNPNLQNIPARGDNSVRRMFRASEEYSENEIIDNKVELSNISEVLTDSGWKLVKELQVGDILINEDDSCKIVNIFPTKNNSTIVEILTD